MSMKILHKKIPVWIVAIVVIIVVAVAALVYTQWSRAGRTDITAYFDNSVGVSAGTDVRILGVKAGSVDEVTPKGDVVEVKMHVNRGVDVPADAKAAQVTPSVIPDRYVQLLPAYSDGPKMESGAVIERENTSTPVEVDRLYKSLEDLTTSLGPDGANSDGSLNRVIESSAKTLGGNGRAIGDSIDQLSKAATALSDSREDFAGTVTNLQSFVTMLAQNDQQVRTFNDQLATFNKTVANQRENLQLALHEVSLALADVARLVRNNQDVIQRNSGKLATLSGVTADKTRQLQDILTQAPNALTNLIEAYDSESGTLQMRLVLPETQSPASAICKMMDLSRLSPGNPAFKGLTDQAGIQECENQITDRNEALKNAVPHLPLGVLQGELAQSTPAPGTQQGTPGYNNAPESERNPR
ncbi:MCE family protein [Dietzia sp.]|uniref:MCE family protein n=1 Tax=Dietzia sp. TaxID=1871616 RepID=UPI002FD8E485